MGRLPKVLLIDDCEDIGFLVTTALKPYLVKHVVSIQDAKRVLENEAYDLMLIDVNLPDGDGFKMCQDLESDSRTHLIPRILLTSRNSSSDLVFGFNCGADDYIKKPFDSTELRARVDNRLRHFPESEPTFTHGVFEFDTQFLKCRVLSDSEKTDLQLTPTEFHILVSLTRSEGSPLSRRDLVDRVWKSQGLHIEARGVDTHIAHLRKKLGQLSDQIISVYGKGYAFKATS
jgi:DNA-binding response OmpR family regulator